MYPPLPPLGSFRHFKRNRSIVHRSICMDYCSEKILNRFDFTDLVERDKNSILSIRSSVG